MLKNKGLEPTLSNDWGWNWRCQMIDLKIKGAGTDIVK
jgi:hypothetical protein